MCTLCRTMGRWCRQVRTPMTGHGDVGYGLLARKGPQVADVDQEAILSQVGGNIQERRNKAGLTQRDLADLAGVDRAFLNQVEQGMRNPTVVVLAKLARALDITVSTLTRGI